MPSDYHFLLFTILMLSWGFTFVKITHAVSGETVLVNGWTPIKNLKNTKVVDVGKFAVARHNFEDKTRLVFDHLVNGETRSQGGTEYNITIAANEGDNDDDDTMKNYVAVVFDISFRNFMHLASFRGPV
ncbi:cysteine proteinase inhibitor 5-like [Rutidosis leptorrhynchoides]|uniref:cysteine proteinase inhibitor 5-like n=1 Tax=Rutidosis leptorrhynchoides TaxID=125765 RepID=UPI003A994723